MAKGLSEKNKAIAREVQHGASMTATARKHGLSRGRVWQIFHAFCIGRLFGYEYYIGKRKPRKLKELRYLLNKYSISKK